jgi:uncharacterized protein
MQISGLYVYPIKSCGGLSLQNAELSPRGVRYDRQWMIVQDDDEERGMFLTQRELPALALIQPTFDGDYLSITAPSMSALRVPLLQRLDAPTLPVIIWRDTCLAVDEGDEAATWVSDYLGVGARLVRMHDGFVRSVDPIYSPEPAQTGFADAYPLLVISEASLADLNARLNERGKATLPMSRFRPNVVVSGADAYAEDTWTRFYVGDVPFDGVKTCARCAIPSVDQQRGTIPVHGEPLATLATYRRIERGVIFGQNVVHRGIGTLRVGDKIRI